MPVRSVSEVPSPLLIELNKNKLDVDEEEYNSKKFDIKFSGEDRKTQSYAI